MAYYYLLTCPPLVYITIYTETGSSVLYFQLDYLQQGLTSSKCLVANMSRIKNKLLWIEVDYYNVLTIQAASSTKKDHERHEINSDNFR